MSDQISIATQHYPPGFRFHPSDEELIVHYLMKRLRSCPLPAPIVAEIELYNYNPWDLPNKSLFGEDEWYFFTPRDRKYPNGVRPNRTAASGFWKATGTDKPILSASGSRRIGVKKALVFYTGRPPKGQKTDWIMTEYRLPDTTMTRPSRSKGSMRLDDWVLCRIRQKGNTSKNSWAVEEDSSTSSTPTPSTNLVNNYTYNNYMPKIEELPSAYIQESKTTPADTYLWKDCQILMASMLSSQDLPPIVENRNNSDQSTFGGSKGIVNSKFITRTNSFLENMFLNPTKPKLVDGNNVDGLNEVIIAGNLVSSNMMNSYNQNQGQGNNLFSPAQSDAVMSLRLSREGY